MANDRQSFSGLLGSLRNGPAGISCLPVAEEAVTLFLYYSQQACVPETCFTVAAWRRPATFESWDLGGGVCLGEWSMPLEMIDSILMGLPLHPLVLERR